MPHMTDSLASKHKILQCNYNNSEIRKSMFDIPSYFVRSNMIININEAPRAIMVVALYQIECIIIKR